MLILTRKVGETIKIGDNIEVTVLGVKGNQVRVGVNAPREVPVHREEVYEKVKRETGGQVGVGGKLRSAPASAPRSNCASSPDFVQGARVSHA